MWSRATQPGTRPPGLMRELRVRHGCRADGGVPSHPPVPLAAIPAAPSVPPHERPTRPSARPIRRHGVLASAGALLAISTLLAVAALAMPDRSSVGADRDSSTANTTSPATLPAPTLTVGGKPTDRNLQPPAPALAIPSTLGSPIEVAPTPASISLAPDSRHAYVLHGPAGLLTVLDTATDEVTGRIDLQSGSPQHLSVTRDGSKAFVSVLGAPPSGSAVAVVDTATSVVLATFPLDRRPGPLTVGPDQRFLYVASSGAAVTVIDATTGRLITEVALPGEPGAIRISPDGAWVLYDIAPTGSGVHDLWLVRPDGSEPHAVTDRTTTGNGNCCGTWSPDGQQVLFQTGDATAAQLWVVAVDGTGATQVTTDASGYSSYSWAPTAP